MLQNAIQDTYGIFASATSTGQTLWFKESDYQKVKKVFSFTKAGGQYVLMVNKTTLRKMNLLTH